MKIDYLPGALRELEGAPGKDRWQARVDKNWRSYFKIVDDTYVITEVIPHPKK